MVETPWGPPSDQLFDGAIGDQRIVFLPRHGRGHHIGPSAINARANIDALKRLGATDVLSLSACGSLREDLAPGDFVLVDQFIDRTFAREKSFFGTGMVAHVSMAHPVCPRLAGLAGDAAKSVGARTHSGATYLVMEGPQFSTLAESKLYRAWGCDVIGMTNMPEAKLAREAELPYALVGMVTDYDCWRDGEAVDVAQVVQQMQANGALARAMVANFIAALPKSRDPSPIDTALDDAVITSADEHDPAVMAQLDAVAGRLFG